MRWLALVFAVALVGTAASAPQIEIRSKPRLTLDRVRLLADGDVEVTGQLIDRFTGAGIRLQSIRVQLGADSSMVQTSNEGKFIATLVPQAPGPVEVRLQYFGHGNIDPAAEVTVTTDPSRALVVLAMRAEEAPGGVRLTVEATVDDQPVALPIKLAAGAAGEDTLAELKTLDSGTPFLLTRALAGGPGSKRVLATFAGDAGRQPASAELTIELRSISITTMKLAAASLAYEDELVATGKVTDEDGRPVAQAALTLQAADRAIARSATGDDGTYRFEVEAEILGKGRFGVQVHASPKTTSITGSRSDPEVVKIAAPQPVPVSYTVAAFLATALAAGGFFTARAKPWRRFRRPAPPAEAPARDDDGAQLEGGLVVAKPGLVSTLRRAYDDGFAGVVRDTVRGRPVDGAVVRLMLGDQEREIRAAPDGSFAIERLAVGEWRAEVAAPGHVTELFGVSVPHRGELRGVRVDLVPVRERVFQLYRRAAEPVLPESRLWGIWSPRQIVDHVRSKRPSPELAELTDFVEEVYFSARLVGETVLPHASERVDRAIRERARV